ncbi:MAG: hypothetical protein HQL43_16865 [Alphaproteobacteria bacterium]|nr:hypothetical protein [Alphaproteobacteria bacterium]
MRVFTDAQMYRPLFEEPTPALERETAFDGALGFMVGGMANLNFEYLGQQYFDAASLLAKAVQSKEYEDYSLANPILYLYRHSVELFLKAALGNAAKSHDLACLAEQFQALIKVEFDYDVPDWIGNRLKELAAIDPNSTAFRYSQNFDKATKRDIPVDGEYHVDLGHLQSSMLALSTALIGVVMAIAEGEGKSARAAPVLSL